MNCIDSNEQHFLSETRRWLKPLQVLLTLFFLSLSLLKAQPLGISFQVNQAPSCGVNNGLVTLTGTGGSSPYFYAWDNGPFGLNGTITGVSSGLFLAQVTDANEDTAEVWVLVSDQMGPDLVVVNQQDPTCSGGQDGSLLLSGSGQHVPFQYSLGPGNLQSSGFFDSLSAGVYPVLIMDTLGCMGSAWVSMQDPTPLSLSVDAKTDVDCFGENTGFFTVSAQGGNAGAYQFSLDSLNFQTSGTFSGLGFGQYNVFLVDGDGCGDSLNLMIDQPLPLSMNLDSVISVACYGDSTGSIYVRASGGVGPYLFGLGNTLLQTDSLFAQVPAGDWALLVQDANGCLVSDSTSITQPNPLQSIPVTLADPLCFGDSSGQVEIMTLGGQAPYSLSWSQGQSSGFLATDLPAGTTTYVLTDSLGCSLTDSLILGQPAPLSMSLVGTAPSCSNSSDGILQVIALGGTPNYEYLWSHDPALNQADALNLAAGSFYVTVTDSNGCQVSDTLSLAAPLPLTLSLEALAADTCLLQRGFIEVGASGGTGNYGYVWDLSTQATGPIQDSLGPGFYTVVVLDGNGCTDSLEIELNGIAPLSLTLDSLSNVSCYGLADGTIGLSTVDSLSNVQFLWSDIGVGPALRDNLLPGNFTIIADDGFCSDTLSTFITQPTPLTLSLDSLRHPACPSNSGLVRVSSQGGNSGYTYAWSHDPLIAGVQADSLVSGLYIVSVEDQMQCRDTLTVELVDALPLNLSLRAGSPSCVNTEDGWIQVVASGGRPPYQYIWNNGGQGPALTDLAPGAYRLRLLDQNGCFLEDSVQLNPPVPLRIGLQTDAATCYTSLDGTARARAVGGRPPYSYYWSNGENDSVASGLAVGQWRLQVQDQNQCVKDTLFMILSPPPLVVIDEEVQSSTCGQANGLIALEVEGGVEPYRYEWEHTNENTALLNDLIGGDPAMVYSVRIIDQVGCEVARNIFLENIEPSSVEIIPPFDPQEVQIYSPSGYQFATRATNAVAYEWEVDGALVGVESTLEHRFRDLGLHQVILTAYDESLSCPSRDTIEFTFVHRGKAIFPNAFTPNGDGRNDQFKPGVIGASFFEMTIYDRWGKLLTVERQPANGWDGNLPTGVPAPEGVYAYRALIRYNDGREELHGGSITLLR